MAPQVSGSGGGWLLDAGSLLVLDGARCQGEAVARQEVFNSTYLDARPAMVAMRAGPQFRLIETRVARLFEHVPRGGFQADVETQRRLLAFEHAFEVANMRRGDVTTLDLGDDGFAASLVAVDESDDAINALIGALLLLGGDRKAVSAAGR